MKNKNNIRFLAVAIASIIPLVAIILAGVGNDQTFMLDISTTTIIVITAIVAVIGTVSIMLRLLADKIRKQYPKLSIVGIIKKRKVGQLELALVIVSSSLTLYIVLSHLGLYTFNSFVITASFALIALLFVSKSVFEYRVKRGLYGKNEHEAREIIRFILQEASNIDFTDGGDPKKIISADDLEELEKVFRKELQGGVVVPFEERTSVTT